MAINQSVGKVSATSFKDAEKEALNNLKANSKVVKASVPKEVAPKAPTLNKTGKAAGNFGIAGNL